MEGGECANGMCAKTNLVEWTEGWPLKSGGFAALCHNCGFAYKNLTFCETFHSEDSGWRECTSCGKRLHCGCIASISFLDLLDTCGVKCRSCTGNSQLSSAPSDNKHKTCSLTETSMPQNVDSVAPASCGHDAEIEGQKLVLSFNQPPAGPSATKCITPDSISSCSDMSLVQTNLSINFSYASSLNNVSGLVSEERELQKTIIPSSQQGFKDHFLPRLPCSGPVAGLEQNTAIVPQLRVARPPVEGRVKSQLLPRYWPRITDQELQQISGDSNCTIVPLFEKVLSASDAGRIGRLVLPKACAEAYFPPITQPEGLPLRIQDVKGNEWMLQFRFWPNNNSRMYVLEGVTPCIQSMQLQAGDTVTFSRIDPEGKFMMGFRKSPNSTCVDKDPHGFQGDLLLENAENSPVMTGYSSLLSSSEAGDDHLAQSLLHKRRNIGSKSKRLLIDDQDSLELKLTWEELQDMLRPPPTAKPSTISIEDHDFEEFEEPPLFAKQSIFVIRLSGECEQLAQCDCCFKWGKFPADFLLPPKWTCQDNVCNTTRSSCSNPDELSSREIESLLAMNRGGGLWQA